MTQRTFSAILHKEVDLYVAECPEVGTVSQGPSIEEALANLKEATELYLEEFPLPEGERPLLTTFEVAIGLGRAEIHLCSGLGGGRGRSPDQHTATLSSSTLSKCRTLLVTSVKSCVRAVAAIRTS